MTKGWYNEIKNYDFKKWKSKGGVIGHFTQLVLKDSKEVGFGIAFGNGMIITVANYYPGGNFNYLELENIGNLILKKEKTCKELFQCESKRKNEFELMNKLRKIYHISPLELDDHLNDYAMRHAGMMGKTGKLKSYDEEGSFKHSNNWEDFNLK